MQDREPQKEIIAKGELFFLWHPGTENIFSGYGLTTVQNSKDNLVGVLMVDRPRQADPKWLKEIEDTFGEYQLVAMTAAGERGVVCRMQIDTESAPYVRQFPSGKAAEIQIALQPLLKDPPGPLFILRWNQRMRLWQSMVAPFELGNTFPLRYPC